MGGKWLNLAGFLGLLSGLGLAVLLPLLFFTWLGSFLTTSFPFPKAIRLLFVLVGVAVGVYNAFLLLRKKIS